MARRRSRPIALPKVRAFDELFTSYAPWVFGAKNRVPGVRVPATDHDRRGREVRAWMEIGPFLTVDPGRHSFSITPAEQTVDTIQRSTISIPYDDISFEVIVWDPTEALVVASHNKIIGSMWLAVIDPLTVPGWLPSVRARDALAHARRTRDGDAYLVAADVVEEDGGDEFEAAARNIRTYAKEAYRLERRRKTARARRTRP